MRRLFPMRALPLRLLDDERAPTHNARSTHLYDVELRWGAFRLLRQHHPQGGYGRASRTDRNLGKRRPALLVRGEVVNAVEVGSDTLTAALFRQGLKELSRLAAAKLDARLPHNLFAER
jgi:hypothetical protein